MRGIWLPVCRIAQLSSDEDCSRGNVGNSLSDSTRFDLQNFWRQSTATFKASLPKYTATFRVAPAVFPRLSFAGRFARVGDVIEKDSAGWFKVSVGFDVEEMACEYALGFGPNLEVIEPETLRKKVVEMARQVVALYER